MTHVPHELHEEFPEKADVIHRLKTEHQHFARLADEYHALNREIHRVEERIEPATEEHEEDLKKRRVHLKDELAAILNAA